MHSLRNSLRCSPGMLLERKRVCLNTFPGGLESDSTLVCVTWNRPGGEDLAEWGITSSLMAQMVKNLPARQETWVQSLGQEEPLENPMDRGA